MKYYFITYQAINRDGTISVRNAVINESPLKFIKKLQLKEKEGRDNYYDFVVLNIFEISLEDYNDFRDEF